jgi:hypothetical protein
MTRVSLLIIACWFLLSILSGCRVKKEFESNTAFKDNIEISDTSVYRYERVNVDWIRINETLFRRDGMVAIAFDSLTSVIITRENQIEAIGYSPRITSATTDLTKLNIRDSIEYHKELILDIAGVKKKANPNSKTARPKRLTKLPR